MNLIKKVYNTKLGILCVTGLLLYLLIICSQDVSAEKKEIPYMIKVNRALNTVTVFAKDDNGKYTKPYKAIVCSVGTEKTKTVLGTYKTSSKYRWRALQGNVWGQYATRIVGGILFHSVYYMKDGNPATLSAKEYNNLGSAASHGCIRISVADAKWIYENCPSGTTVVIYDDAANPGPLGKPEAIKIPTTAKWDPTDPDVKNPYQKKMPMINGAQNLTIAWGTNIDVLKNVTAKSSVGLDITSNLIVTGAVNPNAAGKYLIEYSITDALGRTNKKKVTITVVESIDAPVFVGIKDHIVRGGRKITRAYALDGVQAYLGTIKLIKNDIELTIDKADEEKYLLTYYFKSENGKEATGSANFYIDSKAPEFMGIADRSMELGQKLDVAYALSGVTVSDNYANLEEKDINVKISENTDKSYTVTYQSEDDCGNIATESVKFQYVALETQVVQGMQIH